MFVTNNATKSRKSYKTKFDQLGIEAHVVSVGDMEGTRLMKGTLGRDLRVGIRSSGIHLIGSANTQDKEGLCRGPRRSRRRIA